MAESSFFDRMISNHLRSTSNYYTGYPKDLGPSRVIHFASEREFVQLLHEGRPMVVAFTIRSAYTKHLDKVLEEATADFYPHIKFMRVECPKYPGFCITRQRKDYPFIEIIYNPEQAVNQGRVVDPNITEYSVKILPYNYDVSAYGLGSSSSDMGYTYQLQPLRNEFIHNHSVLMERSFSNDGFLELIKYIQSRKSKSSIAFLNLQMVICCQQTTTWLCF